MILSVLFVVKPPIIQSIKAEIPNKTKLTIWITIIRTVSTTFSISAVFMHEVRMINKRESNSKLENLNFIQFTLIQIISN